MTSPTPARRRNPALIAVDVVAGVLILGFGAVLALAVVGTAFDLGGVCTSDAYAGADCNATTFSALSIILIIVAVLAIFLGFGMFVVSLVRKRVAFYWPLIGVVITIAVYYLCLWIASNSLPVAS